MKVLVVNHNRFEAKLEEALCNARDRGEEYITFIVMDHAKGEIIDYMNNHESIIPVKGHNAFLIKHMRITLETYDYYV